MGQGKPSKKTNRGHSMLQRLKKSNFSQSHGEKMVAIIQHLKGESQHSLVSLHLVEDTVIMRTFPWGYNQVAEIKTKLQYPLSSILMSVTAGQVLCSSQCFSTFH